MKVYPVTPDTLIATLRRLINEEPQAVGFACNVDDFVDSKLQGDRGTFCRYRDDGSLANVELMPDPYIPRGSLVALVPADVGSFEALC